ncbi:MAG: PhzF family phenazine biosynthesis protein [Motiliproteus sp.]|nr:PhzF family phenazine biosynthesis protein [Motiliproteus sp.]MCW9052074.1 PhzF family phenazine biosynthesis protein [Motiliproteus sp.]
MEYQYFLADAFTSQPYSGAQIAVFPDAEGLSEVDMQKMARELNHSESVFVLPPENPKNNFKLAIYSPNREVHAGAHTLIASAYVLAEKGRIPLMDEHAPALLENQGALIQVHISHRDGTPTLMQYSQQISPTIDRFVPLNQDIATMLSLSESDLQIPQYQQLLVAQNQPYLVVPVRSLEALSKARFNFDAWSSSTAPATMVQEVLLVTEQTETTSADFHARLLGPQIGLQDDPPVGPALPAFAGYLCAHDGIKHGTHILTVERGIDETRKSLLHMEIDKKKHAPITLRVGGEAVLVGEGVLYLQHQAA